ncbi:uncharacterized protein JCM6883_006368 [Sporobolomyces salmoneus]|uniref:uncharacterized protein n=1 Tax=Sporobolomyces salmoneus TaxID=183962 RepID=UPI003176640D
MEEQQRDPAVDPSLALASLSLLSFLSLSPSPTLVLRITPLLEALRHRQSLVSQSEPHSPAWSNGTYQPRREGSAGPGEGSDLLGGLEGLSMRTPSAAQTSAVTDDYFSLSAGGISSHQSSNGGAGEEEGREGDDRLSAYLSALEPAWKNRAWRDGLQVVEGSKAQEGKSTRRSSIAQSDSYPNSGVTSPQDGSHVSAAAGAAARKLRETFAKMAEGSGGMDDRDITMKERLGTVLEGIEDDEDEEEEEEENDVRFAPAVNHGNDDYEPENGVETWRASWNFLSTSEQRTLLNGLLDFLEQTDISTDRDRRPSMAEPGTTVEESPHSSICSLLPEGDEDAPGPVTNSILRLPSITFTAVLTSSASTQSSSPQFLVLSTSPPADNIRRLSEQFRSQRHASTSSSLSAVTPGPSLLQRQQQQHSQALSTYQAPRSVDRVDRVEGNMEVAMFEDPWARTLGETEMARRIREHRWDQTELGPISEWPVCLKTTVSSIIASPFRECILWGPNKIIVYNDPYIETAQKKHPELLGVSARVCWAELWDELEPVANRALAGECISFNDHYLVMERDGFLEETYHSFTYAPLRDGATGSVVGILNLSIEATAAVVAARRLSTIRDLIQMTSLARTVEEFATSAMKAIAKNPYDVPFAILYHVEELVRKPSTKEVRAGKTTSERKTAKLTCKGSIGIGHEHPFLVHEAFCDLSPARSRQSSSSASTTTSGSSATAMDIRERLLDSSSSSSTPPGRHASPQPNPEWSWPFEEACLKRQPVLIEDLGALGERLEQRGWEQRARSAVVIPIRIDAAEGSAPTAVIVLGLNPMAKRLDENPLMKTFFDLISRHIAIGLFSVLAAEQDRRRAEELLSLDQAKSNFFSSVSHDLRTPLTLILSPLGDILEPAQKRLLQGDHAEKLSLVQKHANRLLNMVNKLLDFSSVEGGRMTFRFSPVKIGNITRELASLFSDAIERARIGYVIECEEDPMDALPVYLAPELWEKIMMNILGNALKYTQRGRITVSLKSTRGEAVLTISDTGVGIPQDELGKIFERFHRVQTSSKTTTMSTGIGLALTLELVKLIGGQLEVESELGKGSTFTVRLPRGFHHLPIEQVDHAAEESLSTYSGRNLSVIEEAAGWRLDTLADSPAPGSSSSSISGSIPRPSPSTTSSQHSGSGSGEDYLGSEDVLSLKNRTIVLVDDSRDLRNYMTSLLSTHFTVVPFGDSVQALAYIESNPPNLVVTDAMMPGLTGNQLTSAIRQNSKISFLPIVMVSAQAGLEARAEALEGGLDDYLVKPFQPRELIARVKVHLQLGLMRGILEERVAERTRALIESEARNRALAERYSTLSTVSPVGIVQIDQDGNLVYANPAWFAISGHDPNSPLSEWKNEFVPEDVARLDKLWESVIVKGQAVELAWESVDRQFRFKSGKWAQLELRQSTEVGLPAGWVGALTDITQQKRIEELHIRNVEERMRDVEENRRQMEDFLDFSSHENRNPLSGVWQNAEVVSASLEKYVELLEELQDGELPPPETLKALHDEMLENTEAMESILLCTAHQGRIADDILNVSKLNMGLLTINLVPFELVPRIVEVKRMFEAECQQKQIDLRLVASSSINELNSNWVTADPARLHQILLNFLSNSVKYTTDQSHRKITIKIEAHSHQPAERPGVMRVSSSARPVDPESVWIVVGVADNGRGLSEEELLKLFARFSQANPRSDQVRYPTSSGLGLYISKKLVELHSGFIEVESRLGVGSIFSFAIPAQRAEPQDVAVTSPLSSVPIGSGARTSKRPLTSPVPSEIARGNKSMKTRPSSPGEEIPVRPPVKVLVVEDNLVNQKILCRQLKNAGYDTEVANNGLEALEAFERDALTERSIKICLCDIQMPVLDGLSAIRILREKERDGTIKRRYPCIAVTGNARQAQQDECLSAGFDFVLSKPYTFSTVVERIEALKLMD